MASKKKAAPKARPERIIPPGTGNVHLFPCDKAGCVSCRERGETVYAHLMSMELTYFTLRESIIVQNIVHFTTDEISELVRVSANILARANQRKHAKSS